MNYNVIISIAKASVQGCTPYAPTNYNFPHYQDTFMPLIVRLTRTHEL